MRRGGDVRRRHVDSFRGFGLDLAWLRDRRRLKPEPWMRGVHGGNARESFIYIYIHMNVCDDGRRDARDD